MATDVPITLRWSHGERQRLQGSTNLFTKSKTVANDMMKRNFLVFGSDEQIARCSRRLQSISWPTIFRETPNSFRLPNEVAQPFVQLWAADPSYDVQHCALAVLFPRHGFQLWLTE